jgi:hypothetical protein
LRDRYAEIQALGGEVVVIGTGDIGYARAFAEADRIPFPVVVADDARAAEAAGVERAGLLRMFAPSSFAPTARALRAGFRIGRPGKRVSQMGATFVVAPGAGGSIAAVEAERGARLLFRHYDAHPADHAPMDSIFEALRRETQGREAAAQRGEAERRRGPLQGPEA